MRNQRGMSAISILFLILVAIVCVKAGMALVPMYWNDKMVGTILDGMYKSHDVRAETSPTRFKKMLEDRLSSNNLNLPLDSAVIVVQRNGLELNWEYEQRANWIGNVDLVMNFHHQKDFSQ